jgi:Na+/proline symporter
MVLFVVGIIAAAFSSADSALAALTTSFSVDILGIDQQNTSEHSKKTRMWVHIGISVIFAFIIIIFKALNNKSVIDAIYIIASYTYGPLLGMYAFGLFTAPQNKRQSHSLYCHSVATTLVLPSTKPCNTALGYSFGYELLMLNGLFTFVGLWVFREKTFKFEDLKI